ncbi:hypothetical protein [Psychrobacillus sp. L3]|uniref:hypothetical protein n=1 Tax=Psychrobacillus sp. L3 TaxID=3236891 RepID=UPI0036F2C283
MKELKLPNQLEKIVLISLVESPSVEGLGILILGENFDEEDNNAPVIRVYQLMTIEEMFEVDKELHAFTFFDFPSAILFAANLPNMSALELLLAINSFEPADVIVH